MHGLGNDFMIVEDGGFTAKEYASLARGACQRRWSVGADGLVVLQDSSPADFRMRFFNPDGSEAGMCGNALRCVARYMHQRKGGSQFSVETGSGIQEVEILPGGWVKVNMGFPEWDSKKVPVTGESRRVVNEAIEVEGTRLEFTSLSMGNPHGVIFVGNLEETPWERWGELMEWHPCFPEGVNVEFVQVINPELVETRVWERGAGATLACGSGACAVAVAGVYQGKLVSPVEVRLPGGPLRITWAPGENVYMEGPAEEAYRGEIDTDKIMVTA